MVKDNITFNYEVISFKKFISKRHCEWVYNIDIRSNRRSSSEPKRWTAQEFVAQSLLWASSVWRHFSFSSFTWQFCLDRFRIKSHHLGLLRRCTVVGNLGWSEGFLPDSFEGVLGVVTKSKWPPFSCLIAFLWPNFSDHIPSPPPPPSMDLLEMFSANHLNKIFPNDLKIKLIKIWFPHFDFTAWWCVFSSLSNKQVLSHTVNWNHRFERNLSLDWKAFE